MASGARHRFGVTRRAAGVGWWFESAVAAHALPAHSTSASTRGRVKVHGEGKGSADAGAAVVSVVVQLRGAEQPGRPEGSGI
jgi:hypothetical protein